MKKQKEFSILDIGLNESALKDASNALKAEREFRKQQKLMTLNERIAAIRENKKMQEQTQERNQNNNSRALEVRSKKRVNVQTISARTKKQVLSL